MKRSHLFAWFASTIIITASAFAAGNSKFAEKNDINTKTYQAAKDAVAIIEGKQGSGTGFICEMDGQKYLVTNRHVADQRGMIVALFQDGSKITFTQDSSIEMAINRDLVRFKVDTEKKGVQ